MTRHRKVSCLLLIMVLLSLVPAGSAGASPVISLIKDGIIVNMDFSPFMLNGHPGIYLRDAAQLFGGTSKVEADKSYLWANNREFVFDNNLNSYSSDGRYRLAYTPSFSNGTSTLISLETIGLELDYQVIYDETKQTVYLNSPAYLEMLKRPGFALSTPERQQILLAAAPGLEHWGNVAETPSMMEFFAGTPMIAGFYTRLHGTWERTNNIQIASSTINGTVLQPGQVFSFNDVVGQRTAANGYLPAPIFSGDAVISGYGGGVCQVASTLYNVVLLSGLPVLERYTHSQHVVYVPDGYDATVSWGSADFKFQNSYDYPIEIFAEQFDNYVVIAFFRLE